MGEVLSVSIRAGGSHYEALIGAGLLPTLGARLHGLVRGPRCAVIVDENSGRLFGEAVSASLRAAGFEPSILRVPAGERAKSLEQAGDVCEQMATAGLDRSSFVVAVGGGVVGDLAGFAAAIFHRGLPYVQVPTTLLAQVDSSIGGKTGVNLRAGKNLLGAVHQPVLVLADTETLVSLPPRELRQGFAEIVKHGIIADPTLFAFLDNFDRATLPALIRRNIAIKADVVAQDEQDISGERAILNFGHTIGHAIEQAGGYREWLHGEAISLGMVAALSISTRRVGLPEADRRRVLDVLQKVGLPTALPKEFQREAIVAALPSDKKFERGQVRFVVTSALGSARLTSDVSMEDLRVAVAEL